MEDLAKIVNLIFEAGTAGNILRSHCQVLKNVNDSIASHSFRTAIIGLILASLENANKDKVVMMCLLHDFAELRTGDANFINSFYRIEKEEKAIKDQWSDIPISKETTKLLNEYRQKKTKEAIVAKDADILDQIFLQREYLASDSYSLIRWHNHKAKDLKTSSACRIAALVLTTRPLQWIYDFSDSQKRKK